jgi:hypothetical protein
MKNVRGANSGFIKNGQLWSTDSSGCLRVVLLRDHAIESPKDERALKVFQIGFHNEALFKTELEHWGVAHDADVAVDETLRSGVSFQGHMDFKVYAPGTKPTVYELKSVTSENTYKKVFVKGEYKYSNLAQLLRYMLASNLTNGVLRYTSFMEAVKYKEIDGLTWDEIAARLAKIQPESVEFKVEITDSGKIEVDGKEIIFDVFDALAHTEAAAYVLEKDAVFPDRPKDLRGDNPCHFCQFRNVCDRFDESHGGVTTEQFLKLAKEASET